MILGWELLVILFLKLEYNEPPTLHLSIKAPILDHASCCGFHVSSASQSGSRKAHEHTRA